MPLNADVMNQLTVDGYTAKSCENAFYVEGEATDVTLRNFYFEDCLRGIVLSEWNERLVENVLIERGTIISKDDWSTGGILAPNAKGLTVKNLRIPSMPKGVAIDVEGNNLGDVKIINCNIICYHAFARGKYVIDGGYYKSDYVFLGCSNIIVKNAYLETTYRMFHNSPSDIHFENCILNLLASDGTEANITFRRCTIADKPTENSGTATFSGDGSTTDFLIGDHGLAVTDPNRIVVKVTPISTDAIAASPCVGYVDPNDNTKIRVKFASAPASGTDNVKIAWKAEVIS